MKNILIVSNSLTFIDRNRNLLTRTQFSIFTATNLVEILAILGAERIDLILVDIRLADVTGESFCRLLRAAGTGLGGALLLVCQDAEKDFVRLRDIGADALLARPLKPLPLIDTVGRYLRMDLARSERVPLKVKVVCREAGTEFLGKSLDISVTGMLIGTEFPLAIGKLIQCRFSINTGGSVDAEGSVVRSARSISGNHQYGICFSRLDKESRAAIDGYIASVVGC